MLYAAGHNSGQMIVVPYKAEHLLKISLQDAQLSIGPLVDPKHAKALEQVKSFTGIVDDSPVVCAGIIEMHDNRALVWAYVDRAAGKHFISIHKAVKNYLNLMNYKRIEAEVDADFKEGHRWVEMLGFEFEARLKTYFPDGRDCALFARFN